MSAGLLHAMRAMATRFLLVAAAITFFATGEMITAFRHTGDSLRVASLYLIAIIMPWVFLFTERRKGAEERVAAAPLVVGLFSVHIASQIMERAARGSEPSSGFPWSGLTFFTLMIGVLIVGASRPDR